LRALPIRLGSPALSELAADAHALRSVRASCEGARHLLSVAEARGGGGDEARVLMLEGAGPYDILLALLHAGLVTRHCAAEGWAERATDAATGRGDGGGADERCTTRRLLLEAQDGASAFADALRLAGWDVRSASRLEELPSRLSFPDE
jgi:hypothetical protein